MIIALDSPFREVQFWYKYHLILTSRNGILNLFSLMHKLSRSASVKCRLMKPNRCVSSPSTTCINRSDLSPHLGITHLITYLSLSSLDWFVQLGGSFSLLRMCGKRPNFWDCSLAEFLGLFAGRISGKQTSVDQGLFDLCWLRPWGHNFDFGDRIHWHRNQGDWDNLTRVDFGVDFKFDCRNYKSVFSLLWLGWPNGTTTSHIRSKNIKILRRQIHPL